MKINYRFFWNLWAIQWLSTTNVGLILIRNFRWGSRCFYKLKTELTKHPVVILPLPQRPYMIHFDASTYDWKLSSVNSEMAAIWMSALRSATGARRSIRRNQNTRQPKKKCFAVVLGIQSLRQYFKGKSFKLQTDHNVLKWILIHNNPYGMLMRWRKRLIEFNY